ncbi:MAG: hypothetical protein IRZ00_17025 [Gemmatimonadetes bacterium]|nr:hypothetical protein [Gemmatimonadota bacterium]
MQRVAVVLRWFAYGWAVLIAAIVVVSAVAFVGAGTGVLAWLVRLVGWQEPLADPGRFLVGVGAVATTIVLAPPLLALHYAERLEAADRSGEGRG